MQRHPKLQKIFSSILDWNWFGLHRKKPFSHLCLFRNIIAVAISIYAILVLTEMAWFQVFLSGVKSLGYVGMFLGGMLFASSFTVTTGLVILTMFAHSTPLILLACVAGIGAAVADLTLFELVRSGIVDELKDLAGLVAKALHLHRWPGKRFLRWALPLLGAVIIASPLPDELGVGMLGFSRIPLLAFVLMTFVLNTLGILSLVALLV